MAEGERDITAQIELGGKGRKANGEYQTHMSDSYKVEEDGTVSDSAKTTYEDIDGFEWVAAAGATDGSTFTIVDPDGPCEIGEMAPRGEMCPVSASASTVFTGASSPFLPQAQFRFREFMAP